VVILLDGDAAHVQSITDCLRRFGATIPDLDLDRNHETNKTRLAVDMRFSSRVDIDDFLHEVANAPGVLRIRVQRPG